MGTKLSFKGDLSITRYCNGTVLMKKLLSNNFKLIFLNNEKNRCSLTKYWPNYFNPTIVDISRIVSDKPFYCICRVLVKLIKFKDSLKLFWTTRASWQNSLELLGWPGKLLEYLICLFRTCKSSVHLIKFGPIKI